jgi:hypothetical protein
MKIFLKSVDKTGRGFEYVRNTVPNVSDAKIKAGIFIGPQIKKMMQNKRFDEDLKSYEHGERFHKFYCWTTKRDVHNGKYCGK